MADIQSKKKSNRALLYSIGYVGLSTIFLYSIYPSDPFSFDGLYDSVIYSIISLLVLPGQLFSWGIRFAGVEQSQTEFLMVIMSQIVNVFIWWRIILYAIK
ncbi:MAG: hypothetical protein ACJA1A_002313 [Saprospiraceae bacterium]|mgnify:CR=1 FL=1|jgi:hypothetical protein